MGQPGSSNVESLLSEYIGQLERTQGTETSKYLQEEKSTEIPGVAASEMGRAQTIGFRVYGVVGCVIKGIGSIAERIWKGTATEGESPVRKMQKILRHTPE